jgi:hypothetical protein
MATTFHTGLRISRPLISGNGSASWIDDNVRTFLAELNTLLGKRVFARDERRPESVPSFLAKALTPKHAGTAGAQAWRLNTAGRFLARNPADHLITLSEHIDSSSELANLKYAFLSPTGPHSIPIDEPTRSLLREFENITDYLVAYAYHELKLKDPAALGNFILEHPHGVTHIKNYAAVSAARKLIQDEQLNVPNVNDDDGRLAQDLTATTLPISRAGFEPAARARIDNLVFNSKEEAWIEGASVGEIPEKYKPRLISLIKQSPFAIDAANIDYHLPVLIAQVARFYGDTPTDDASAEVTDQEFEVQFRDDEEPASAEVSAAAVRCTAQLYHGMVIGDELDVFGIMDYFAHQYLLRGDFEIRDKRLRSDLRLYVFSSKFIDVEANRILDRTQPHERQIFYRQVFNERKGEVAEDVIANTEFSRLWKVLILESAKFLQRAQSSYYPDLQSKQNVMQAVEDLRYNLSNSGTGLVNVVSPLIDSELNFVLTRILDHPEVRQHVVPRGGGWKRVVETLALGQKKTRVRASTYFQKAKLGERIIRAMADYSPATFESDTAFNSFISDLDAYISTQSILQEALKRDLMREPGAETDGGEDADEGRIPTASAAPDDISPGALAGAGATNGHAAQDEWDF